MQRKPVGSYMSARTNTRTCQITLLVCRFVKFSDQRWHSNNLPSGVHDYLLDRWDSQGVSVKTMSLSPDDDRCYVVFTDGSTAFWNFDAVGAQEYYVSFFPEGGYFMSCDGGNWSYNLPHQVQEKINNGDVPNVVASGGVGCWFADFGNNWYKSEGVSKYLLDAMQDTFRNGGYGNMLSLSISACGQYYWCKSSSMGVFFLVPDQSTRLFSLVKDRPTELNPEHILFSQDSICRYMSGGHDIYDVAQNINRGALDISDMNPLQVVWHANDYYAVDNPLFNTWLWIFKQSKLQSVNVQVINKNYLQLTGDGYSVQVYDEESAGVRHEGPGVRGGKLSRFFGALATALRSANEN